MKIYRSLISLVAMCLCVALPAMAQVHPSGPYATVTVGAFTASHLSGCTAGVPTASGGYRMVGRIVHVNVQAAASACTSTAATIVLNSNLPRPASAHNMFYPVLINGAYSFQYIVVSPSGTITYGANLQTGGVFSGTVNGPGNFDFTYSLD